MDDQFVFTGRFPKGRVMLVQGQEVGGLRDQPLERIRNVIDRNRYAAPTSPAASG